MSLLTYLAEVLDFCQPGRNFRHPLLSILVISVLAILCGADDFEDIADFGQQKQALLARHLPLTQGIPSADTFRRVLQHLDAQAFNQAFLRWVRHLLPAPVAAQVSPNLSQTDPVKQKKRPYARYNLFFTSSGDWNATRISRPTVGHP
jgi:hypothetical protein